MANEVLYLIGSLRNKRIPELAKRIRADNPRLEVFDDWYAAGPEADDFWKSYEQERGSDYQTALKGYAARNVFNFDKRNLNRATHALLVLPAGKSGHMEIMYAAYGVGAKTAILLDPDDVRWDVMYQFVPDILNNDEEISEWLTTPKKAISSPVLSSMAESHDWNSYPDQPSKGWLPYSDLVPASMRLITGGAVSSIPVSSALHSATSTPSTTEKTKTRKAR